MGDVFCFVRMLYCGVPSCQLASFLSGLAHFFSSSTNFHELLQFSRKKPFVDQLSRNFITLYRYQRPNGLSDLFMKFSICMNITQSPGGLLLYEIKNACECHFRPYFTISIYTGNKKISTHFFYGHGHFNIFRMENFPVKGCNYFSLTHHQRFWFLCVKFGLSSRVVANCVSECVGGRG